MRTVPFLFLFLLVILEVFATTMLDSSQGADVYACGRNFYGELGDGTSTDSPLPKVSAFFRGRYPVTAAAGEKHSLVATLSNQVLAFGSNDKGQLGLGTKGSETEKSPSEIASVIGRSVISFAAGSESTIAVVEDGLVFAWGSDDARQLGFTSGGRVKETPAIVPESIKTRFLFVVVGAQHALGIAMDYSLYSWGRNSEGQLGLGRTVHDSSPAAIFYVAGLQFEEIGVGQAFSAATTRTTQQLWTWGSNTYGQLCHGDVANREFPTRVTRVPSGATVISIATGLYHTLFLTNTSEVYSCGRNDAGQLGLGDMVHRSTPTLIRFDHESSFCDTYNPDLVGRSFQDYVCVGSNLTRTDPLFPIPTVPKRLYSGEHHSFALMTDGNVFAWGLNERGQLCLGASALVYGKQLFPAVVVMAYGKNVSAIAGGGGHTLLVSDREYVKIRLTTPSSGPMSGGTSLYVIGTGFLSISGTLTATFSRPMTNISITMPASPFSNFRLQTGTPDLITMFGEERAMNEMQGIWKISLTLDGVDFESYGLASDLQFSYFDVPGLNYSVPRGGPVEGGSRTVIYGNRFNVDSVDALCLFGELSERTMYAVPATVISDTELVCYSPAHALQAKIPLYVSMNGEDFSSDSLPYYYYRHPTLYQTSAPLSIAPIPTATVRARRDLIYGGPIEGGTVVDLMGSGFAVGPPGDATILMFDKKILSFEARPDYIRFTAPALPADYMDAAYEGALTVLIQVSLNNQDISPVYSNYTYYWTPTVTSFLPLGVPGNSTTTFEVHGTRFAAFSWYPVCRFGEHISSAYVLSDTLLACAASAKTIGMQNFSIALNRQNFHLANTQVNIYPMPSVFLQVPNGGIIEGGTRTVLNGTGFTIHQEIPSCRYGSDNMVASKMFNMTTSIFYPPMVTYHNVYLIATPATVLSDTQMRCVTVSRSPGYYNLSMTLNGLDWLDVTVISMKFYPKPQVIRMFPEGGPMDGGTLITLTGIGFSVYGEKRLCAFGRDRYYDTTFGINLPFVENTAAIDRVLSTGNGSIEAIVCEAPPLRIAGKDIPVALTLNGQDYQISDSTTFIFYTAPTLLAISPFGAPTTGNFRTIIFGFGFDNFVREGFAMCKYGETITVAVATAPTQLTCITPPHIKENVFVEVTLNGQQYTSGSNLVFSFYEMPELDSLFPRGGKFERDYSGVGFINTTLVTLSGTGFLNHRERLLCRFNHLIVSAVALSDTQMQCSAPPDMGFWCTTCKVWDVNVEISLNGQDFTVNSDVTFRFFDLPKFPRFTPLGGPIRGGTIITVTGLSDADSDLGMMRFNDGSVTVSFGGTLVTCEAAKGPVLIDEDFDPEISEIEPDPCDYDNHGQYDCPTSTANLPTRQELLAKRAAAYIGNKDFWDVIDGVITTDKCGSASNNALLFTGGSEDFIQGRSLRSIPVDTARGFSVTMSIIVGNETAPGYCEAPEAINTIDLKVHTTLDDSNYDDFITYYTGMNKSVTGIDRNVQSVAEILKNSTKEVWRVILDLEIRETLAWKSTAVFSASDYHNLTTTTTSVGRNSDLVVCLRDKPCKSAFQELMFSEPWFASGPFDVWSIDDLEIRTAGGISTDNKLYCEVPPVSQPQQIDIQVAVNSQQFEDLQSDKLYFYYPEPVLQVVQPNGGSILGGTVVTVIGSGFTVFSDPEYPPRCRFGNIDVSARILSDTQVRCVSPASMYRGLVLVGVTLNGQDFTFSPASTFTYYVNPDLNSFFPESAVATGGTRLYLNGTGFSQLWPDQIPYCVFRAVDNGDWRRMTAAYVHNDTFLECTTPNVTDWFPYEEVVVDVNLDVSLDGNTMTDWQVPTVAIFKLIEVTEISSDSGSNTLPVPIILSGSFLRNDSTLMCGWKTVSFPGMEAVRGSARWKSSMEILCLPPKFPGQKIQTSDEAFVALSFNKLDLTNFVSTSYTYSTPQSIATKITIGSVSAVGALIILIILNALRVRYKRLSAIRVETDGDWLKPSLRKALEHQSNVCPRTNVGGLFSLWETSAEYMGNFGVGLGLYFQFLKYSAGLFIIMGLVSSFSILLNSKGGEISGGDALSVTTLGNLPTGKTDYVRVGAMSFFTDIDIQEVALIQSLLDIAVIVVFLVGTLQLRRRQRHAVEYLHSDTVDASVYTVYVENIPSDAVDPDEFRHFFKEHGEIADIAIAVNNFKQLKLLKKRDRILDMLETAEAKLKFTKLKQDEMERDKLKKQAKKYDARLERMRKKQKVKAIAAFVTFNKAEVAQTVAIEFADTLVNALFTPKKRLLRGRVRLSCSMAMEAIDIYWENLQFRGISQLRQRTLTNSTAGLLLIGSFAIILFTRGLQNSLNVDGGAFACLDAPDPDNPKAQEQIMWSAYIGLNAKETYNIYLDCYCSEKLSSEPEFCQEYVLNAIRRAALVLASVGGVVIINALLKNVLQELARTELHHTITSEERAITTKIFIAQFMNTAMMQLIVNAKLDAFFPELSMLREKNVLTGEYEDITSDWYKNVGSAICFTVLTNAFTPNVLVLAKYPITIAQRFLARNSIYTQRELNRIFEGPIYALSERYGIMLNMLFTIMTYSSGMPVLLWFMALFCILAYWSDKIALLRVFQLPPRYDERLAVMTTDLMPIAAILHLMFAVWMLGAITVDEYTPPLFTVIPFQGTFKTRVYKFHSFLLLAVLVCVVAWQVIEGAFGTLIQKVIASILLADEEKLNKVESVKVSFLEAKENEELSGLPSYQLMDNPRYMRADLQQMKMSEMVDDYYSDEERGEEGEDEESESEEEEEVEEDK